MNSCKYSVQYYMSDLYLIKDIVLKENHDS